MARSECVVAVAVLQVPVAGGAVLGRPAIEVAAHLALDVAMDVAADLTVNSAPKEPPLCSLVSLLQKVMVRDKLAQQQLPRVLSPA